MSHAETIHRGTLTGTSIGVSVLTAACELVGLRPESPNVRLRWFVLSGEPATEEAWPDVTFELVEKRTH